MRRILIVLALWMALVASVFAQNRPAVLTYTHFGSEAVRGYRFGEDFLVPLEQIEKIGWQASTSGDTAKIIAEASTLTAPIRYVADKPCVPIRKIIQDLGGVATWLPGYDSLEVLSQLDEVAVHRGVISIKSPLGIKPVVSVLTNPNSIIVDIEGAKLTPTTRLDLESEAKVTQYRANSVRIVMKTAFMPRLPKTQLDTAQQVVLDVNPLPMTGDDQLSVPITRIETTGQSTSLMDDLPIFVELDNPKSTLLSIRVPKSKLTRTPDYRKPAPDILEVTLPGIIANLPTGFTLATEAVKSAQISYENGSSVLRLQLARAMGAEVWSTDAGVQIQLTTPTIGGSLSGKIVVVDAGHGGKDGGCHAGGIWEKDLTLAIATELSSQLAAAGATVLMTRKGDTYPTLDERCELANRNKADFFISIHINSPGKGKASPSGTQTYWRMKKPMSKLLAECVHRELMSATGMPNQGYKSDRVLYEGGLKVLRDTKMPAILVECGFITHPTDRTKMQQKSYRQSAASSIVKGLKVYLGQ